jgi:hypothetical protein
MITLMILCISSVVFTNDVNCQNPGQTACTGYSTPVTVQLTPPQQMPGWPQVVGSHANYKPSGVALVDITNDGLLEIIVGSTNNMVYVWDYQGNAVTGWPITLSGMVQGKVAVGDIDDDGDQEVIIATRNGYVHAYHHDGTLCTGWPQNANGVIGLVSPSLFDLDRDGDLEILMVQMQSGQPGHVYVWHHDGQVYPGWPQNTDYLGVATPAVADIDNDTLFEIVALSYRSVYVWDQNGNPEPGWPKLNVASGMSYAQPVLADLDDDGDMEILHAYYLNSQDYVGIYHHDGTAFTNWPQTYPGPQTYTTPVTGDIDDDWDLEIFGGGHVFGAPGLLARHHTGGQVSGWPVTVDGLECSPIVLDIDDDGMQEILSGDNYSPGSFYAYEGNGALVADWPVATTGATMVNSAAAADVDGDGDIEIALIVNDGTVNLWTLDSVPYRGYLTEWRTGFHDNWNTGWLHPKPPQNLRVYMAPAPDVHVGWSPNSEPDLAGYNVYRSYVSGGPYFKVNDSLIVDTIYFDYEAIEDTIYYYCATALTEGMAESRLSNEDSIIASIQEQVPEIINDYHIFPNPCTQSISFACPPSVFSRIVIYDVKGACIKHLNGWGTITWQPGSRCSQGVYFARIERGVITEFHKIIKME